jgi:hypothetical protein
MERLDFTSFLVKPLRTIGQVLVNKAKRARGTFSPGIVSVKAYNPGPYCASIPNRA